jgi:cyclic pyranopterin phosphate synthase
LPQGYIASEQVQEPELSIEEIRRLVSAFSKLGFTKIRLTGGEPTVRRDIVDIVQTISTFSNIKKIAITTNGNRLTELAAPLRLAGVSAINISVDSLDEATFNKTTGTHRFTAVMAGVEEAVRVGFESIKLNAVLLRDTHEDEIQRFMEWVQKRPISVRFIELMRTGKNAEYFSQQHVSGGTVQFSLLKAGWEQVPRLANDGPAVVYRHPHSMGSIGIIAPYSSDFCTTCNRLRVSSRAALRLCLFGDGDVSLRRYLQDDHAHSQNALMELIQTSVKVKPISHYLHEGNYGNTSNLSGIGG